MGDRDRDLDKMLRPLRAMEPTEIELQRWRSAMRRHLQQRQPRRLSALGLIAASIAGIVLGAAGFAGWSTRQNSPSRSACESSVADNDVANATYEHIAVKLD